MGYTWRGDPAQSIAAEEVLKVARKAERVTKSLVGVFDPSKCGTRPGYYQHGVYDVPRCQPCKDAESKYARDHREAHKRKPSKQGFDPGKCGTRAGYRQHLNHAQTPCDPCRAAYAEYSREYRQRTAA